MVHSTFCLSALTIVILPFVTAQDPTLLGIQKEDFCTNLIKQCPFANPQLDCVQRFCTGRPNSWGGCQVNGPGPFVSFPAQITHCCNANDPNACFGALQGSGSGSGSTYSAPGACATVTSILTSCLNADAGYKTQALVDRAQCLCYNADGTYNPSRWDNAELACSSIGPGDSAPQSNLWAAVSSDGVGWCTRNARDGAGSAAAAPTTTGAAPSTTVGNGSGDSSSGGGGAATSAAAATGSTASVTSAAGSTVSATSAAGAGAATASASPTKAAAGKVVRADEALVMGVTALLGLFVVVGVGML